MDCKNGYTAVVETKSFEGYDGELGRSQMCTIYFERKLHSVEILDLSDEIFKYVFTSRKILNISVSLFYFFKRMPIS